MKSSFAGAIAPMSLDWANIVSGAVGALGGAGVNGLFNYLAKRNSSPSRKAQDFSTVVQGFNKLVKDLQTECERLGEKVEMLSGNVEVLVAHIDSLEAEIRKLGATPPQRPALKVARA